MTAGKTDTRNHPSEGTLFAVKKIVPYAIFSLFEIPASKVNVEIYLVSKPKQISSKLRDEVKNVVYERDKQCGVLTNDIFLHPTPDRSTKRAMMNCTNIPTMTVCQLTAFSFY